MSLATFSVFTVAGSGVWNVILIGLGVALGTQYALVDRYSRYINYALYAVIAGLLVWLVVRRVRRARERPGQD